MSQIYRPEITEKGMQEELRSVIAIFRHADRTPKQKMKMRVRDTRFLSFFSDSQCEQIEEVKLKKAKELQSILNITNQMLKEYQENIT